MIKTCHLSATRGLSLFLIAVLLLSGCAARRDLPTADHTGSGFPTTISPPLASVSAATVLTSDQLMTAFYQGKAGNCASIAVIKTAMAVIGINKIYTENAAMPGMLTLNNGEPVIISAADLKMLADKSKFVEGTDKAIWQEAMRLYAIMVTRKMAQDSRYNYLAAVGLDSSLFNKRSAALAATANALNSGQTAKTLIPLLGLEATGDIPLDQIALHDNLIVTSFYHAAFSSCGYYDEYGHKTPVSDYKANRRGFWTPARKEVSGAYSIKP